MTTSRALTVLMACLVAATAIVLSAAVPATQEREEGFTPLFNGKDFTGWVYGQRPNGTENKSGKGYQIENGVIYSTKEDGGNLYTEKEYANFVFRFEFKLTPNANNGIGIRAPLVGDAAYVGMEIQVLDDSGSQYTNLLPGQYHGSIYKVAPAKRGFQKPVGEWNSEEITANGRRITVKLNGTTIVDFNLDDVKDEATLKEHRDLSKPEGSRGIANTKGHIGFLGHGRTSSSATSGSRCCSLSGAMEQNSRAIAGGAAAPAGLGVEACVTLVAMLFAWLAFDDITTDNATTGFVPEYTLLAAAGAWLLDLRNPAVAQAPPDPGGGVAGAGRGRSLGGEGRSRAQECRRLERVLANTA